jgi:hypothetical protein
MYTARMRKRYASKAQKVVLAAAVFDKQGRILVNPDGLVPSEMITDTFLERASYLSPSRQCSDGQLTVSTELDRRLQHEPPPLPLDVSNLAKLVGHLPPY